MLETRATDHLTEQAVRDALAGFVGELQQVPTAVSAVKVDGKRAYQRVRDGEDVELAPRQVTVHELEVREVRLPEASFSLRCTSGTYVRAIARDAGAALGVGGHLTRLRRTAVGPFGLADAVTARRPARRRRDASAVLPIAAAARSAFPVLDLDDDAAAAVRFGRPLAVAAGGDHRGVRTRRGSSSRCTGPTGPDPGRSRSSWAPDAARGFRSSVGSRRDDLALGRPGAGRPRGRRDRRHHRQLRRRPPRPPGRRRPHLRRAPSAPALPVVAVTFDPHPMAVLRPDHAPQMLTTLEERAELLAEAGVDDVLALPFDREIAAWSPQEFVDRVLVDALHARVVVVGANFRFGHRAAGDVAFLLAAGERAGFTAEGVELDGGPQVWSSTYVRTCLAAGDVAGAAEALGRPFSVRGVVVRGDQRGRELGYPTANVPTDGLTAAPGRRRLRRLAAAHRHRRDLPGGDQRRHQPDLRRRPGAARGELRARPRRPRALRRRGRGRRSSSGCAAWSPSTASSRWWRRWPTTSGGRGSCWAPDVTPADPGRRRPGSARTGCPTSCPACAPTSARALRPRRFVPRAARGARAGRGVAVLLVWASARVARRPRRSRLVRGGAARALRAHRAAGAPDRAVGAGPHLRQPAAAGADGQPGAAPAAACS